MPWAKLPGVRSIVIAIYWDTIVVYYHPANYNYVSQPYFFFSSFTFLLENISKLHLNDSTIQAYASQFLLVHSLSVTKWRHNKLRALSTCLLPSSNTAYNRPGNMSNVLAISRDHLKISLCCNGVCALASLPELY